MAPCVEAAFREVEVEGRRALRRLCEAVQGACTQQDA